LLPGLNTPEHLIFFDLISIGISSPLTDTLL